MKNESIANKISALNRAGFSVMAEEDNISIIKIFTNECIKIFEADFGFAWGKFKVNDMYSLVYKSPSTNFNPIFPFEKKKDQTPSRDNPVLFDSDVKKTNYNSGVSIHLKSYIVLPIRYFDHAYGSIILGYKEKHSFSKEDLALAETAGNIVAQSITINWLVENEQKALVLAEKQKATEVLLSEEKLRNEFISNATHELRTPLAIIKGNVDLALQGGKKNLKSLDSILEDIDEETKHLSGIVSDLALLQKKNPKSRISGDKINLRALITKAVERGQSLAYKKNISITAIRIPDAQIKGNKSYLEKMLINLIKNSVSYGRKGGFTKITSKTEGKNIILIVTDNGLGISTEDLPHVFERFYRGDKAHSGGSSHSGLGLAIVKWVAEMHGGTVSVKSLLNKGTTFSVKLPIKI